MRIRMVPPTELRHAFTHLIPAPQYSLSRIIPVFVKIRVELFYGVQIITLQLPEAQSNLRTFNREFIIKFHNNLNFFRACCIFSAPPSRKGAGEEVDGRKGRPGEFERFQDNEQRLGVGIEDETAYLAGVEICKFRKADDEQPDLPSAERLNEELLIELIALDELTDEQVGMRALGRHVKAIFGLRRANDPLTQFQFINLEMFEDMATQRRRDPPEHLVRKIGRNIVARDQRLLEAVDPAGFLNQILHALAGDPGVAILDQLRDHILIAIADQKVADRGVEVVALGDGEQMLLAARLDDLDKVRLGEASALEKDRAGDLDLVIGEQGDQAVRNIGEISEFFGKILPDRRLDFTQQPAENAKDERLLLLAQALLFLDEQVGDVAKKLAPGALAAVPRQGDQPPQLF